MGVKGNKFALGNNGGRPRTVSLPPDDMVKLGEEMLEWLQNNPDTLHLSKWYSQTKMFTYKQWDTFTKAPEFFPYYEKALSIVAEKYIDGTIHPSISQRFLRIYFKDVRDSEDEKMRFEYELKGKAEQAKYDAESLKQLSAVMDQIKSTQDK